MFPPDITDNTRVASPKVAQKFAFWRSVSKGSGRAFDASLAVGALLGLQFLLIGAPAFTTGAVLVFCLLPALIASGALHCVSEYKSSRCRAGVDIFDVNPNKKGELLGFALPLALGVATMLSSLPHIRSTFNTSADTQASPTATAAAQPRPSR